MATRMRSRIQAIGDAAGKECVRVGVQGFSCCLVCLSALSFRRVFFSR